MRGIPFNSNENNEINGINMVMTKQSALTTAFLLTLTAWVVPAFAQTLGSELVANGDFANERPNNFLNVSLDEPALQGFEPILDLNYFTDTVYGKSFVSILLSPERIYMLKVPIQDPSTQRNISLTVNSSAGNFIAFHLGFANNSLGGGSFGEGISFPTDCSYEDSNFFCIDLGNGFSIINLNVSESYFELSEPEHSIDAVFVSLESGASTMDNITMFEDGVTTFFEDFERNLPSGWAVCDFNGNLLCETDDASTSGFMTPDSLLNFTQNSGDSGDLTSQNFTLEADTPYRFVFRWNSTTLTDPDLNNGGGITAIFTSGGMNIFFMNFNNTDSAVISSGNGITITGDTTSTEGNQNVATVEFTVNTERIYKMDIANFQTDQWYLVSSVSMREVIPADLITGNLITGIPATIVRVIALIVIGGLVVGLVYRQVRGGKMNIEEIVKMVLTIIVGIAFVGAILSFV